MTTTTIPVGIRWFFRFWAGTGILLLIFIGIRYLLWPGFIDHAGEITMTSVAWLLYDGQPLYTALDAAERYSLQHGPLIYILLGAFLKLFGPGFHSAKLAELLCLFLAIALSWCWFRQFVDARMAFWLLGLEAWLLAKWYYLYLSRSDSAMLLLVLLAMYGVTVFKSRWAAILGTALPLGLLANCKIHEILWALPVFLLLWRRQGARDVLLALALLTAVVLAPFLAPNISLVHYLQWLGASTTHGISLPIALGNMAMLLLLFSLPVIVAWGFIPRPGQFLQIPEHRQYLLAVLAAALPVALIGSKAGSGSHHLAPLIPFLMYTLLTLIQYIRNDSDAAAAVSSWRRKVGYGLLTLVCLAVFLGGINGQGRILKYREFFMLDPAMMTEFQTLRQEYRGQTLMIGYGDNDRYKWYNQLIPLLVFDGNPYLLDAAALNDMGAAGLPLPPATLDAIRSGVTRVWLLPTGQKPFALANAYISIPVFSEEFRQTFFQHYQLRHQTRYFDVWIYQEQE